MATGKLPQLYEEIEERVELSDHAVNKPYLMTELTKRLRPGPMRLDAVNLARDYHAVHYPLRVVGDLRTLVWF